MQRTATRSGHPLSPSVKEFAVLQELLRARLGEPSVIETLPGVGYRMAESSLAARPGNDGGITR